MLNRGDDPAQPPGHSRGWTTSRSIGRAGTRIQRLPTCSGLGFILPRSGELLKGSHRSFLGQVNKAGWGSKRESEGEGKKPSWQVFRAQSRGGNASLPLIASRPAEFLEETAAEILHKSHCCACVGCLLKEVKGHRLWYIKKKKKSYFNSVEEEIVLLFHTHLLEIKTCLASTRTRLSAKSRAGKKH